MKIDKKQFGDVTVVRIDESRLGADIAGDFKAALASEVGLGNLKIVLDLSELTFMDSSGLGALVAILKLLLKRGELLVAGPQDAVRSLFKLTRMDKVFRIYETTDEALEALALQTQVQG